MPPNPVSGGYSYDRTAMFIALSWARPGIAFAVLHHRKDVVGAVAGPLDSLRRAGGTDAGFDVRNRAELPGEIIGHRHALSIRASVAWRVRSSAKNLPFG
jgi:hypothetical protein